MQKYNNKITDVNWPLPQEQSEASKRDKEYLLKLSSNDTEYGSPFDFKVKFAMEKVDISNNKTLKKEAVVQSKYQDIASLEVSDVVIPRFIPSVNLGNIFDGVKLIKNDKYSDNNIRYLISAEPGIDVKFFVGVFSGPTNINCIKITNHKETIILTQIATAHFFPIYNGDANLKDAKIYDHININNCTVPIQQIEYMKIVLPNNMGSSVFPDLVLPTQIPLSLSQVNLLFNQITTVPFNGITITKNKIIVPNMPIELTYQILKNSTIRVFDSSGPPTSSGPKIYYYKVDSVISDGTNIIIRGNEYGGEDISLFNNASGCDLYLYQNGCRDLLDERILHLEIDPFIPVKSTTTSISKDKMFGLLFPSTQSKNWVYLSGEPKETFLPSDYRKLDRITIRLYDSNGNSLNEVFETNKNMLKNLYNNSLFTSMVLKINEVERTLIKK